MPIFRIDLASRGLRQAGCVGLLYYCTWHHDVWHHDVLGQIIRHFANQGRSREIYFYRDHHGREVDFLIPSAGRFALIECKWAESPGSTQRGFSEIETLVGADRIISQTIVTPERGTRRASERVTIADSVALDFLRG